MKTRFWILLVAAFCCAINGRVAGYDTSITNCCPVAGGFMVEWVPAGSVAQVKWSPDLVTTPFTDLSAKLPYTQSCYTDTVHSANSRGFYRVELEVPEGMVLIPGGTNSGTDPDFGAYSLTVEAFYMDATEVSKAQWDMVYNWAVAHGYSFDHAGSGKASNHPVQSVSWYDCVKWCNARSQMANKTSVYSVPGQSVYRTGTPAVNTDVVQNTSVSGYRLPTNTEWEYAARGGYSSRRFPWGDTISHSQANYRSSTLYSEYDTSSPRGYHPDYDDGVFPYTSPVGSFASNGYGLYDMTGNIWEWCWDPAGPYRYFRGGGWDDTAGRALFSSASFEPPGIESRSCGFRSVRR